MFLFYLWCPWWRLSQILVPLSGLMGASRDSLRFFGGACVCEGGQVCQGKAPGANVGVTGSGWTGSVTWTICSAADENGEDLSVMSCGPWMKGRPFLLLRWMSAGSCVSTLLSCPLRVPLWLWHYIKGLRPPWTERMDVGCQLALIWFQLWGGKVSLCFLAGTWVVL